MDLDTFNKMIEEFGNYPGYGVHNGVDKVSEKLGQPYDATRAIRSQYLQRKSIRNHYKVKEKAGLYHKQWNCLLYTSPSPRDATLSRMPSSA